MSMNRVSNLSERLIPYSIARFFSAGSPALLQLLLISLIGASSAGRFYVLISITMFLVIAADSGANMAFPVLFGPSKEWQHPGLPLFLRTRLTLAIIFAFLAAVPWIAGFPFFVSTLPEALTMLLVIPSRVLLLSHQGYHYSRSSFGTLQHAAMTSIIPVAAILPLWYFFPTQAPLLAYVSFLAATLTELRILDCPDARPFLNGVSSIPSPVRQPTNPGQPSPIVPPGAHISSIMPPLILFAFGNALLTRCDGVMVALFLNSTEAGIFGTLDVMYRLLIQPPYLNGQANYPRLNKTFIEDDSAGRKRLLREHLILCWSWLLPTTVICGVILYSQTVTWGSTSLCTLAFLLCLPFSGPNSMITPWFMSIRRPVMLAGCASTFGVLRAIGAYHLVGMSGSLGLAINHLGFYLLQFAVYGLFARIAQPVIQRARLQNAFSARE